MTLADIANQYYEAFCNKYGSRLLPGHQKALRAIKHCRTPAAGMTLLECTGCHHRINGLCRVAIAAAIAVKIRTPMNGWKDSDKKLLPVEYFMVTFTLPATAPAAGMAKPEKSLRPAVQGSR